MADDLTPVVTRCGVCVIRVWPETMFVETVWPDGAKVPAAPNFDDASCALAAELGYKDTWAMSLAHETLHTWLAVQAGLPFFSPTLWYVAHQLKPPRGLAPTEEARVLAFQAALNGRDRDRAALDTIAGWFTLVAPARAFLAGLTDPRRSIIDPFRFYPPRPKGPTHANLPPPRRPA